MDEMTVWISDYLRHQTLIIQKIHQLHTPSTITQSAVNAERHWKY